MKLVPAQLMRSEDDKAVRERLRGKLAARRRKDGAEANEGTPATLQGRPPTLGPDPAPVPGRASETLASEGSPDGSSPEGESGDEAEKQAAEEEMKQTIKERVAAWEEKRGAGHGPPPMDFNRPSPRRNVFDGPHPRAPTTEMGLGGETEPGATPGMPETPPPDSPGPTGGGPSDRAQTVY